MDLHNLLAQPSGSTIKYNYQKSHCTTAAWSKFMENATGHYVYLIYTQYVGFRRGDDHKDRAKFPANSKKWHCPTRLARMLDISCTNDVVYFTLFLEGYPDPAAREFGELAAKLEAKSEVPFDKLVGVEPMEGRLSLFSAQRPSVSTRHWEKIVAQLDKNSQFNGDSFWRLIGPYYRSSRALVGLRRTDLVERKLYQYVFRDAELAYFNLDNRESHSRVLSVGYPGRKIRITMGEGPVECRESVVELRQYFESTLFFRAKKMENTQPTESVIGFLTDGERSKYPLGPAFGLPIRVEPSAWKLIWGGIAALGGAIYAAVALREKMDFTDLALFSAASVLFGCASLFLYSKLKLSLPGDD